MSSAATTTLRGESVSVLGVFKDGSLHEGAWGELGAGFGDRTCLAGFDEALRMTHPEVAERLERRTRDEGLSETFFGELAPSAQGNLIMTLIVSGHVAWGPERTRTARGSDTSLAPMRAGGRKGSRALNLEEERLPDAPPTLHIAATLYSKREHRVVATLEMDYGGKTLDDAASVFWRKWRSEFPPMDCRGWQWPAAAP